MKNQRGGGQKSSRYWYLLLLGLTEDHNKNNENHSFKHLEDRKA